MEAWKRGRERGTRPPPAPPLHKTSRSQCSFFSLELIKFLKKEVLCASLCSGQHLHPEEEGGEGRCAHLTAGKAGAGGGQGLGGQGLVWGWDLGRFGPTEPGPAAGSLPMGRAPLGVGVSEPLAAGFALGFSAQADPLLPHHGTRSDVLISILPLFPNQP